MKRRRLALLMALALCICVACENQIPASAPTESSAAVSTPALSTPAPTQSTTAPAATDSTYINITMLGITQIDSRKSENDILTPLWREKTGVAVQVIAIPDHADYTDYLSQMLETETLPDMIALDTGIFDVPERYGLLKESDTLLEIPYEAVEEHMPQTARRLESMGITLSDWYDANIDLSTGKWLYIPTLPSPLFDESIRGTDYGIDNTNLPLSYIWVRDDILQAIRPDILTALDLSVQFGVHGDDIAPEILLDWDINDLDGLGEYMAAVAALSDENDYSLTPMRPVYNNTASAVIWSLFTAGGSTLSGNMPEFSADTYEIYSKSAEWKRYIAWLNASNSKGYFGSSFAPSTAVRPADNTHAMLNWWITPSTRATSPITGIEYGWRLYPVFTGSAINDKKASTVELSLRTKGAVGFNKNSVSKEMLPALLRWVDWNYSLEAQDIRNWGIGMTAGEGDERRFTEEFGQVREYMINSTEAANDGWHFGLVNTRAQSYKYWNHEVYGVGGSDTGASAPFYTYPMNAQEFDQSYFTPHMIKRQLITKELDMQYVILPHDIESLELDEKISALYEEYKKVYASEMTLSRNAALMDAIRCSPVDFENRYRIYQDLYAGSKAFLLQEELISLLQERERGTIEN